MNVFASSGYSGDRNINQLGKITAYAWFLAILWSLFIGVSCYWEVISERKSLNKIALSEANIAIERDLLYRRWGSTHGGVYAPATANTPPNPYLSHVPERDISTPSGKQLTLINPAYMIRQFYELAKDKAPSLGQGHLTSLKPLRPENKPDPWEEKTLKAFETGTREFSEISLINGKPFMRMMKPFVIEKPCLKCHAIQGYKEGEIRGGLSVSIPIQPLMDASRTTITGVLIFNGVIWLLGLGVTCLGARQLSKAARIQNRIEDELHHQTVLMEEEIAERQLAQESLQESELHLRIVADYSSNWEYWRLDDNSFQYISPSVIKLTGYSINEFMADHELIYRIIHPEDLELFLHHTHETDTGGQILPIEMRIVTKSGEVRWMGHICQRVFNNDGIPWGWRASNQDITALKLLEHELFEQAQQLEDEVAERETAQEELEQLNHSLEDRIEKTVADLRHKDQTLIQQGRLAAMGEMINNIAHQWRQPLNNIGLIIQNLQFSFDSGTISSEELRSEINKAMDIIMHMSRTIDDFRNFFRVDKEKHGFFVNKAVTRALEFVAASLEKRNIRVSTEAIGEVTAIGHQNEYSQVLLNVISNAAETCVERRVEEPHISIRITRENERSVVYIRDNCGGIPDDVLPKIFDPYFTTRSPDKGTGIGLYMSKVIIEQNMAGSLTALNVEGGAEFRIEV